MNPKSVIQSIAQCSACSNNVPLFFEISGQKAMIITASANLQSEFFPLITVRFTRNLLYGLFGKGGLTETGFRRLFESNGIYSTSFNKCYDRHFLRTSEEGNYAMDAFATDKCAKKFLQREIDEVQPELLIVLGKVVCEEIRKLVNQNCLSLPKVVYYSDYFYKEQNPNLVEEIRTSLAMLLNITAPLEQFDKNATTTNRKNAEVHLQFQMGTARALSAVYKRSDDFDRMPVFENEVEQLWVEQVATPIYSRYYIFMNYWSAIESSSQSFLSNNCDPTNENPSNPNIKAIIYDDKKSLLYNMKNMREEWIKNLSSYYLCLRDERLTDQWKNISKKLYVLRDIRNSIVHSAGFIPCKTLYILDDEYKSFFDINTRLKENGFTGIKVIPNMVYITEHGLSEMDELFSQVVELLSRS